MVSIVSRTASARPDVLFVERDVVAAKFLPGLREQYRVTVAFTASAALHTLRHASPDLIVTELDLSDGPGEEICRRAKTLSPSPTVLVTTRTAERVPEALFAGCDGVLLKPFAPNLLYARIGRLLRARSMELNFRAERQQAKSAHLSDRLGLFAAKTNRQWPNTHCPHCAHHGVTSFEYVSYRRSWYACLSCRKVWIAQRQE